MAILLFFDSSDSPFRRKGRRGALAMRPAVSSEESVLLVTRCRADFAYINVSYIKIAARRGESRLRRWALLDLPATHRKRS